MIVDTTSLSAAAVGGALGLSVVLWGKKREMEERCAFMQDAQGELDFAFEKADELLSSGQLPAIVRSMFLHLLHAYTNAEHGRSFARAMAEPRLNPPSSPKENPLTIAMRELGEVSPDMERDAHRAMASLAFSLMFIHLANHIKVERVQIEASTNPESVWTRLWKSLGGNDHHDHHETNGAIPA